MRWEKSKERSFEIGEKRVIQVASTEGLGTKVDFRMVKADGEFKYLNDEAFQPGSIYEEWTETEAGFSQKRALVLAQIWSDSAAYILQVEEIPVEDGPDDKFITRFMVRQYGLDNPVWTGEVSVVYGKGFWGQLLSGLIKQEQEYGLYSV